MEVQYEILDHDDGLGLLSKIIMLHYFDLEDVV
jgi:hypothetical protein